MAKESFSIIDTHLHESRQQKIPLSLHICILRLPAFLQQSIIQGQCRSSCFVSTGAKIVNFRLASLGTFDVLR